MDEKPEKKPRKKKEKVTRVAQARGAISHKTTIDFANGATTQEADLCTKAISETIYDKDLIPGEGLSAAEMVQFIASNAAGSFNLMGEIQFADMFYNGGPVTITMFKYVAYLRAQVLLRFKADKMLSEQAFDLKYHDANYWYMRFRDREAGRPSLWLN